MELLYSKFNRHRLPQFQIETSVFNDQEKKVVVKKALTPEARDHINNIARSYLLIKENFVNTRLRLPGGLDADEDSVRLDYVDGRSLDHMLFQAFLDKNSNNFLNILDDYAALLNESFRTVRKPVITEELKRVFGSFTDDVFSRETPCFAISLIDPVFENILVSNGQNYLIDNEWVFDGCLPVSFALFRSLFYFYQVKYVDFDIESLIPFNTVLERFHLNKELIECYRKMDDHFQMYVFGKEPYYNYRFKYVKEVQSVPLLEETIQHQREVVRQMHDQITELNELIEFKQNEVLELTQLVKEKDRMIFDIINSRSWKFAQIVNRPVDVIFPSGTRRRRVVERLCDMILALCQRIGRIVCRKPGS